MAIIRQDYELLGGGIEPSISTLTVVSNSRSQTFTTTLDAEKNYLFTFFSTTWSNPTYIGYVLIQKGVETARSIISYVAVQFTESTQNLYGYTTDSNVTPSWTLYEITFVEE